MMKIKLTILTIFISIVSFGQQTKASWKTDFDTAWADPREGNDGLGYDALMWAMQQANLNQEYYYAAWTFSGGVQAWQASGDNDILNDLLTVVEEAIDESVNVSINGTYKGWPSSQSGYSQGSSLHEFYFFRHVFTMLRVMSQSSTLLATAHSHAGLQGTTYQDEYDYLLPWLITNVWDKWYLKNAGHTEIYRVNTHMASHPARSAMELYIMEGDAEYLEVFENISFNGAGPVYSPNSLRSQLYDFGNGYNWASSWGGSNVQDTSHGADIISFWVTAAENLMYWDSDDMNKISTTVNDYIWQTNSPLEAADRINGTGGNTIFDASFSAYMTVARFDETLQARMDTYYTSSNVALTYALRSSSKIRKGSLALGIGLYNRTLLDDGRPVYPEFYAPVDTSPGDVTAPVVTSSSRSNFTETTVFTRWYINEGSRGSVVYDTDTGTVKGDYPNETTEELTFPLTHGQTIGGNNAPLLTAGTTYYGRYTTRDEAGNVGLSDEFTFTTLGTSSVVITITGATEVTLNVGDTYTELGATLSIGGAATVGGDTVNNAVVGTYLVDYTYPNADTKTRTVNVTTANNVQITRNTKVSLGTSGAHVYLGTTKVN